MEFNLLWARQQCPIVNNILESGGDTTDCVIELVKQKENFIKEIIKLQGLVPRKIKVPEGKVAIWRCPEEFIPFQ